MKFFWNFNNLNNFVRNDPDGVSLGPILEGYFHGGEGLTCGSLAVSETLKRIFDRYFKFYFAFCLLGFALLILLMNIPRVLADEQPDGPTVNPTPVESIEEEPIGTFSIPEKFYRWQVYSSKTAHSLPQGHMEFTGSSMKFKLTF
jgi:hypothetical protein